MPMLKHEKTLCSNPKLFVLKPVSQRLSNTGADEGADEGAEEGVEEGEGGGGRV